MQSLNFSEVQLIDLRPFEDERGWLCESLPGALVKQFEAAQIGPIRQVNTVLSQHSVLRGLHFQAPPHAQAKLILCLQGEILDVAVDIRRGSATYAQSRAEVLRPFQRAMYVPAGFAHGFESLSQQSLVQYVILGGSYTPNSEGGLNPLDPELKLPWRSKELILHPRDRKWPNLSTFQSPFQQVQT